MDAFKLSPPSLLNVFFKSAQILLIQECAMSTEAIWILPLVRELKGSPNSALKRQILHKAVSVKQILGNTGESTALLLVSPYLCEEWVPVHPAPFRPHLLPLGLTNCPYIQCRGRVPSQKCHIKVGESILINNLTQIYSPPQAHYYQGAYIDFHEIVWVVTGQPSKYGPLVMQVCESRKQQELVGLSKYSGFRPLKEFILGLKENS